MGEVQLNQDSLNNDLPDPQLAGELKAQAADVIDITDAPSKLTATSAKVEAMEFMATKGVLDTLLREYQEHVVGSGREDKDRVQRARIAADIARFEPDMALELAETVGPVSFAIAVEPLVAVRPEQAAELIKQKADQWSTVGSRHNGYVEFVEPLRNGVAMAEIVTKGANDPEYIMQYAGKLRDLYNSKTDHFYDEKNACADAALKIYFSLAQTNPEMEEPIRTAIQAFCEDIKDGDSKRSSTRVRSKLQNIAKHYTQAAIDNPQIMGFVVTSLGEYLGAEQVVEMATRLAEVDPGTATEMIRSEQLESLSAEQYFRVLHQLDTVGVTVEYKQELLTDVPATAESVRALMSIGTDEAVGVAFQKVFHIQSRVYGGSEGDPNLLLEMISQKPELGEKVLELVELSDENTNRYSAYNQWNEVVITAAKLNPDKALSIMGDKPDQLLLTGIAQVAPEKALPLIENMREYDQRDYTSALAIGLVDSDLPRALELAKVGRSDHAKLLVAQALAPTDPEAALQLVKNASRLSTILALGELLPEAVDAVLESREAAYASDAAALARAACARPDLAPELIQRINNINIKDRHSSYSNDPRLSRLVESAQRTVFEHYTTELPMAALQMLADGVDFRLGVYTETFKEGAPVLIEGAYKQDPPKASELLRQIEGASGLYLLAEAIKHDGELYDLAVEKAEALLKSETFSSGKDPIIGIIGYLAQAGRVSEAAELITRNGANHPSGYASDYLSWPLQYQLKGIGQKYPELIPAVVDELLSTLNMYKSNRKEVEYNTSKVVEILAYFIESDDRVRPAIDAAHMKPEGYTKLVTNLLEVSPLIASEYFNKLNRRDSPINIYKSLTELPLQDFETFVTNMKTNAAWACKAMLDANPDSVDTLMRIAANYPDTEVRIILYGQLLDASPAAAQQVIDLYSQLNEQTSKTNALGDVIRAYAKQEQRDGHAATQAELQGNINPVFDPFSAEKDRSFNFNVITAEDIAANAMLIPTLVAQTATTSELRFLLNHLDEISGDNAGLKTTYLTNVVRAVVRFKQLDGMKEAYRSQVALQAQGVRQADHELYAQLPNFVQLVHKVTNRGSGELAQAALEKGYSMSAILDHPWLLENDVLVINSLFPTHGNKNQRATWLADNAFVRLQGFNKTSIGQIINNRLGNNLESSLHDATQWLSVFGVGSQEVRSFNPSTGEIEEPVIYDELSEHDLINRLMDPSRLSAQVIRTLPGFAYRGDPEKENIAKIKSLFHNPDHAIAYVGILRALRKQDLNDLKPLDIDEVMAEIDNAASLIANWIGQDKEVHESRFLNREAVRQALMVHATTTGLTDDQFVNGSIRDLKIVGQSRKAYIDGVTTWLRKYQNLDSDTLVQAWGDRAIAMQAGVEDDPRTIVKWAKDNAFRLSVASRLNDILPSGRTLKEVIDSRADFVKDLSARYDSNRILSALKRLDEEQVLESDMPAAVIDLGEGFEFRVFGKDDPAGFTLGYDTDCCMTLGGASESCIWAGYSKPSAGFVGLYEDGKLLAQSFIWHNDGADGDTIVLDNIEAQRGRSVARISEQYKRALIAYLIHLPELKPNSNIRSVNLGTGYLEGGIGGGLAPAEAVELPGNMQSVYSDASRQLAMLRLSDEDIVALQSTGELAKVQFGQLSVEAVAQDVAEEFVACGNTADVVSMLVQLEQQIYPGELRTGQNSISEDLAAPYNYSFMIQKRSGNAEVVGYMLAYRDEAEAAVYVSDLAILPDEQRAGYGVKALDHLLEMAEANMENTIIFEARESTSYRALQSGQVKELLAKRGYKIASSEYSAEHFENGEGAYTVRLERFEQPVLI